MVAGAKVRLPETPTIPSRAPARPVAVSASEFTLPRLPGAPGHGLFSDPLELFIKRVTYGQSASPGH